MKKLILILFMAYVSSPAYAFKVNVDSLNRIIKFSKNDTIRFNAAYHLTLYYNEYKVDSGLICAARLMEIAKKLGGQEFIGAAYWQKTYAYYNKGNYPLALKTALTVLPDFEKDTNKVALANMYNMIGNIYRVQQNYTTALQYLRRCESLAAKINDRKDHGFSVMNIAKVYDKLNIPDSAIYYANEYIKESNEIKSQKYFASNYLSLGDGYLEKKNYRLALNNLLTSLAIAEQKRDLSTGSRASLALVNYYTITRNPDSVFYYAKLAMVLAKSSGFMLDIYNSSKKLAGIYEARHQLDSAFKYQKISITAGDSIYSAQKIQEFTNVTAEESSRQDNIKFAETEYNEKLKMYGLAAILIIISIIGFFLWRNAKNLKNAYMLVSEQKKETEVQKNTAEQALAILKQAQNQLIQREKMASLGELTAGIAHEIQNPLNFVNNFSEVSAELIGEMDEELDKGDIEEAKAIAGDVKQNLEKILHHGKRADAIVKGMLQHSRTSTDEKQLTDINVLVDEFLKLSYHGLRAKDKSFNAELVTHFDEKLPKVNIAQQDIGRVLLNLFNNAFYAVNQKAKTAGEDYKPTVTVTTFAPPSGGWGATVRDNGNGIPENIKDKIMQPFFTTKPTGEGTGLGLSLSYDIVVKGHGGKITVDTKENEFTEFTVWVPIA